MPDDSHQAYCNKMAPYAENDKLLIYLFQDSLSGASLEWYTHLERTNIQTWKELADAFFKKYIYNSDMAPTKIQLQDLTQKANESFKQCAQRWRELASGVQPPLLEQELVDMFLDTLQGLYLTSGCASKFSKMIMIGERIEHGLKIRKIQHVATTFELPDQDDEETSAVFEDKEAPTYPPFQIPCKVTKATSSQDDLHICYVTVNQPALQPVQYAPRQQTY